MQHVNPLSYTGWCKLVAGHVSTIFPQTWLDEPKISLFHIHVDFVAIISKLTFTCSNVFSQINKHQQPSLKLFVKWSIFFSRIECKFILKCFINPFLSKIYSQVWNKNTRCWYFHNFKRHSFYVSSFLSIVFSILFILLCLIMLFSASFVPFNMLDGLKLFQIRSVIVLSWELFTTMTFFICFSHKSWLAVEHNILRKTFCLHLYTSTKCMEFLLNVMCQMQTLSSYVFIAANVIKIQIMNLSFP
jgi:hypothetical protein